MTVIDETRSYGSRGFQKREIVVDNGEKYPNPVPFCFIRDDCEKGDQLNCGDVIEVNFKMSGREWKKDANDVRYFVTLEIENFRVIEKAPVEGDGDADPEPEPTDDDCPF